MMGDKIPLRNTRFARIYNVHADSPGLFGVQKETVVFLRPLLEHGTREAKSNGGGRAPAARLKIPMPKVFPYTRMK